MVKTDKKDHDYVVSESLKTLDGINQRRLFGLPFFDREVFAAAGTPDATLFFLPFLELRGELCSAPFTTSSRFSFAAFLFLARFCLEMTSAASPFWAAVFTLTGVSTDAGF